MHMISGGRLPLPQTVYTVKGQSTKNTKTSREGVPLMISQCWCINLVIKPGGGMQGDERFALMGDGSCRPPTWGPTLGGLRDRLSVRRTGRYLIRGGSCRPRHEVPPWVH
jgi:hypothetical protein